MANTVNISEIQWDGWKGSIHHNLASDGTALSNLSILDLSADLNPAPAAIKIRTIQCSLYGNWILIGEFDATTDEEFMRLETQTADVSQEFVRDFTDMPNGGWVPDHGATGFTGDILLTSSGIASGDGYDLVITFQKKR